MQPVRGKSVIYWIANHIPQSVFIGTYDTNNTDKRKHLKPHINLPTSNSSFSLLCSALSLSLSLFVFCNQPAIPSLSLLSFLLSNGGPICLRFPQPVTFFHQTHQKVDVVPIPNTPTPTVTHLFSHIPLPILPSKVLHLSGSRRPPERSQARASSCA